jgi:copper homeostasis protein
MLLEIACFNLQSCYPAQEAGADRIEFCRNYPSGGLTPNWSDIRASKLLLDIPVHIIIRPREGNFIYSEAELKQMQSDILKCKACGIDGVVFGVLTKYGQINEEVCDSLKKLAQPMHCTFHRAIDSCEDIFSATETLIKLGFDSVLTSGTKENALAGAEILRELQGKYGKKINIIAGGGVRSENISNTYAISGCTTFHSAALTDGSQMANVSEIQKMKNIISKF